MVLSRRASAFLIAVGLWSWVIWPTFLRNIWADERSFAGGTAQPFFLVHLVLVVVSLAIGTALGVLGVRGWRGARGARAA
ncbi:SCO4848 family membrane protein [Kineococcus glutinatus]|uniref:Membrane protein n=1 Tax=Kineococcus glutinatus TaxID=1070872 RepID=A0ABP9HRR7_9ACTN